MIFTEEQKKEFEKVSRPLIEFMNKNCHPHVSTIVDCTHAEILEGVCSFSTNDYIKD